MKPKLGLSILVIIALFLTLIVPVSAARPDYMVHANGNIVSYTEVESPEIQGHWNLVVIDADPDPGPHHPDIKFNAFYMDANGNKYHLSLVDIIDFDIDPVPGGDPDPEWWLFMALGTLELKVQLWNPDGGSPEHVVWFVENVRVTIHRDDLVNDPYHAFLIDTPFNDIIGSVVSINYYSLIG